MSAPPPDDETSSPGLENGQRQPSLVPGVVLLGLAAVLIVVVLIKPDMPPWLKVTIAILAVVVVVVLLIYAAWVFRLLTRRGGPR